MQILHKAVLLGAVLFTSGTSLSTAGAIRPAPPTPTLSALNGILGAKNAAERKTQTDALLKNAADLKQLKNYLARKRRSSDAERRGVLRAINAEVPDANGRFRAPGRQTKKVEKKNDDFDWLAALLKLPNRSGLSDVVTDVAIIRALAVSTDPEAGQILMDFAFSEVGLAYRDECGRYLRNMSPISIPALIRGSQNRKNKSMKRYTTYQLERIDRQSPKKALLAATSESLKIEVLKAFADSQYREAVFAVLDTVDDVSPRIRKAARDAWDEFATGRTPPAPPERKLELPNGKMSDEKEPLWEDHRVLADTAIRARLKELTGSKPSRQASLAAMTKALYQHYDARRTEATKQKFAQATAQASAGKLKEATALFDAILAESPDFSQREEMAESYAAYGKELKSAGNLKSAAIYYGKASFLTKDASKAEAWNPSKLGEKIPVTPEAGKSSTSDKGPSDKASTASANKAAEKKSQKSIFLYAGIGALAAALLLFLVSAMRKRED